MFDIHQQVYDEDGERDEAAVEDYCDDLMQAFAESSEGKAVEDYIGNLGWTHPFLHYGLDYPGTTPPEMTVRVVREILFEIFPRKVSVEADEAGEIIAEMRAFWEFLGREYGLPNAAAILRELDGNAEKRLKRELSNPNNFGMAKSFFSIGEQAGFDMSSEEGLSEFTTAYNAAINQGAMALQGDGPSDVVEALDDEQWTKPTQPTRPKLTAQERKQRNKERGKKLKNAKRRKR